jgi:transposase
MQVLYGVCCGLDVHKAEITAALMIGDKVDVRKYGTTTNELRGLAKRLKDYECEKVAMESTGVYWKPIYNILELEGIPSIVVNASHMKAIPGRKTDVSDAEWIGDLLRHGLLKASFIPDKEQREYRELVRYKSSRVEERARELNRLQKMLEGMNIKLGDKVSNVMGKSAEKMLRLAVGNDELSEDQIAEVYDKRLKSSIAELKESLIGIISPLQRELVTMVLKIIEEQTKQIEEIETMIAKYTTKAYDEAAKKLDVLPGIGKDSARAIIAEIGTDMSRFPSANHLCAWAGVVPGNNESAGKRRNAKSRKGNKRLKKLLHRARNRRLRIKTASFTRSTSVLL